jgi:hypothetical protein
MRQRTYGGVRGRGREASPTRSKEWCTSGLISGQVRDNFVTYYYPYNIQIAMMINYNID